jgi:hypothetical protein
MRYNYGALSIGLIILLVCLVGCTSTAPPTSKITPSPSIQVAVSTQPFTRIDLSGSGYGSPKFTIPSDGYYQIDFDNAEHDGHDGAFIVWVKNLSGSDNIMDLVYSGFGSETGSKILKLKHGNYFLDVTSYGDWYFIISQA